MASPRDDDASARAIELLAKMLSAKDLDALVAAFSGGEINSDRVVNELAARYQLGIGSAAQALAEHDAKAAQQLGERLRQRVDEFLAGLAARNAPLPEKGPPSPGAESFKDRDDAVLLREFVILRALSRTDAALRSSEIFTLVRKFSGNAHDEAITAHLARMLKQGVIGRERKGRYNSVPAGAEQLNSLTAEIEARGLRLPQLPNIAGG